MEENRRGEAEGVDSIEDAVVPFDQDAVIADAAIALDRARRHRPGEPHSGDNQPGQRRLPPMRKRRKMR